MKIYMKYFFNEDTSPLYRIFERYDKLFFFYLITSVVLATRISSFLNWDIPKLKSFFFNVKQNKKDKRLATLIFNEIQKPTKN